MKPIHLWLDLYTFIFAKNGDLQSCSYMPDIMISGNDAILSSLDDPASYFNGEEYDDYLVLVVDITDKIVACHSNNKALENDSERQKQLLIGGKCRRLLPDLPAEEPSSNENPTFTIRYIDTTTTINTNAAGEVLTSSKRNYMSSYRYEGSTRIFMPSYSYNEYTEFIKSFCNDGFSLDREEPYFQSRKKSSTVVLPFCSMNAMECLLRFAPAPESMDHLTPRLVGQLRSMMEMMVQQKASYKAPLPWLVHDQGFIEHDEGISFRFVRQGNNAGIVGIDGKVVLHSDQPSDLYRIQAQIPESIVPFNEKAPKVFVGKWITMDKGKPRQLDIVFAPPFGDDGLFSNILFVEVKGGRYERNEAGGPILPLFCAGNAPRQELLDCLYAHACPKDQIPAPVVFNIIPKE